MTEQEWLSCTEPEAMLEFLRGKATDRKLRLFACACCRHSWLLMDDERKSMESSVQNASTTWLSRASFWLSSMFQRRGPWSRVEIDFAKKEPDLARRALAAAEKYADGRTDLAELKALFDSERDYEEGATSYAAGPDSWWTAKGSAYRARWCANYCSFLSYPSYAGFRSPSKRDHDREQSAQCLLLRDIFGNAFRPVAVDSTWLTAGVVQQVQAIYDERAFDRLPELANALAQAGCTKADILGHCRQPGEHVRGCWVVDLLLGKE